MSTPTYYGCARNPATGKIGILAVTKVFGQPSSQTWTGEEYRAQKAAIAAMDRLNADLFGRDKDSR